jgi:glucose/arabinose dehydrogenase
MPRAKTSYANLLKKSKGGQSRFTIGRAKSKPTPAKVATAWKKTTAPPDPLQGAVRSAGAWVNPKGHLLVEARTNGEVRIFQMDDRGVELDEASREMTTVQSHKDQNYWEKIALRKTTKLINLIGDGDDFDEARELLAKV